MADFDRKQFQNDFSNVSTEDLIKMETAAYADYYKLATNPRTNPSKKDLEPLEKATAKWEAISEELNARRRSLSDQIQSAEGRKAERHSNGRTSKKDFVPER